MILSTGTSGLTVIHADLHLVIMRSIEITRGSEQT